MTGNVDHQHDRRDAAPGSPEAVAGWSSVPWSMAASATPHCLTGCAIGE